MHGACTEHLEAQCFRDLQLYLTTESSSLAGQVGYALDGGFMSTNDIILTIDLGDHPKPAIGYHFKTGHREMA
jgi:hypothetical protein